MQKWNRVQNGSKRYNMVEHGTTRVPKPNSQAGLPAAVSTAHSTSVSISWNYMIGTGTRLDNFNGPHHAATLPMSLGQLLCTDLFGHPGTKVASKGFFTTHWNESGSWSSCTRQVWRGGITLHGASGMWHNAARMLKLNSGFRCFFSTLFPLFQVQDVIAKNSPSSQPLSQQFSLTIWHRCAQDSASASSAC